MRRSAIAAVVAAMVLTACGASSKKSVADGGSTTTTSFAFFTSLVTAYTHLPSSVYGGHTSSESIAGRDATCITFKASDYAPIAALAGEEADASVTFCADDQTGFMLKPSIRRARD